VRASYERSLSVLAEYADLEEIELPEFPYDDVAVVVLTAEVSAAQEELIWSGDISRMTAPEDRYRLYARLAVPAVDYIRAQRIRTLMQRELDAAFAPFDAVVTPSLDTVAGPVDVSLAEWSRGFEGSSIGAAANLAGLPGISVPNGFDEDGLPTGLSFTARALEENRVLQVAAEYQRRTDWHEQHPSVE
jgi:aspartyl-tRNA(Asn)/glutamyl-tRNA(Gln) amidotransferase subunit A